MSCSTVRTWKSYCSIKGHSKRPTQAPLTNQTIPPHQPANRIINPKQEHINMASNCQIWNCARDLHCYIKVIHRTISPLIPTTTYSIDMSSTNTQYIANPIEGGHPVFDIIHTTPSPKTPCLIRTFPAQRLQPWTTVTLNIYAPYICDHEFLAEAYIGSIYDVDRGIFTLHLNCPYDIQYIAVPFEWIQLDWTQSTRLHMQITSLNATQQPRINRRWSESDLATLF